MEEKIKFSAPDISDIEIEEVIDTLKSGWITTGPKKRLFERRLYAYLYNDGDVFKDCESEEAISTYSGKIACLSSATAAEELNLRIWGIRPGDEVIVPAYTYTATAAAAIHCGATVKFVDIMKDGDSVYGAPQIDYDALESAITPKTKAVILVDYGGIMCDYDKAFSVVQSKADLFSPVETDGTGLGDLNHRLQKSLGRIAVLADSAHSFGSRRKFGEKWKESGTLADFSSFSFHAVKNLTTGEGGFSTWRHIDGVRDGEIYDYYQLLSLHGQSKDAYSKYDMGAWEYDVIGPFYKCNMTDITASIGLRQLDRYPDLLKRRKQIAKKYDEMCKRLGLFHLNHITDSMDSNCHLYPVRIPGIGCDERNCCIDELSKMGIPTNVHYKPLPMMTAYRQIGNCIEDFPNSYDYYKNLITLPIHTLLSDEEVAYICDSFAKVIDSNGF